MKDKYDNDLKIGDKVIVEEDAGALKQNQIYVYECAASEELEKALKLATASVTIKTTL
jgi:hypothetical protein